MIQRTRTDILQIQGQTDRLARGQNLTVGRDGCEKAVFLCFTERGDLLLHILKDEIARNVVGGEVVRVEIDHIDETVKISADSFHDGSTGVKGVEGQLARNVNNAVVQLFADVHDADRADLDRRALLALQLDLVAGGVTESETVFT